MSICKGEIVSKELPRVKFGAKRIGKPRLNNAVLLSQLQELGALQHHLEEIGVVPILEDGLVGGNCSLKAFHTEILFVSPSGKEPFMELQARDFVEVENFDRTGWCCEFRSFCESQKPTSDLPLHVAALKGSKCTSSWPHLPNVVVHGHALADGEGLDAAKRSGFPISDRETLFSTPDDLVELENLFLQHPYGTTRCYIRRGHGFVVLADSVKDASSFISKTIEPLL